MEEDSSETLYTTPVGTAQFPWLEFPNFTFGMPGFYSVRVALPLADAATHAVIAEIARAEQQAITDALTAHPEIAAREIEVANSPYEILGNGTHVIVKFKLPAALRGEDGAWQDQAPPSITGLSDGISVGEGSAIRVRFQIRQYYSGRIGAGVTLRLRTVEVVQLVPHIKRTRRRTKHDLATRTP